MPTCGNVKEIGIQEFKLFLYFYRRNIFIMINQKQINKLSHENQYFTVI